LHLGKAATYRALGQPVPAGTTKENLARLTTLIEHYTPQRLVFLGDVLHAAAARTPAVLCVLHEWRTRHAKLEMTLVRGNHDRRAGDSPVQLGINVVDEPYLVGPFALCHHPQQHATHFVLAGHVHPVCRLVGRGRDSLRMPCFVAQTRQAILPAFGEFTGGWRGVAGGRRAGAAHLSNRGRGGLVLADSVIKPRCPARKLSLSLSLSQAQALAE